MIDQDLISKIASVAEGLDRAGKHSQAEAIDELLRYAATKKDGEGMAESDYLMAAIDRFADHFERFASKVDGPTSRKAMAGAGIKTHRMGTLVAQIEDALDSMRRLAQNK